MLTHWLLLKHFIYLFAKNCGLRECNENKQTSKRFDQSNRIIRRVILLLPSCHRTCMNKTLNFNVLVFIFLFIIHYIHIHMSFTQWQWFWTSNSRFLHMLQKELKMCITSHNPLWRSMVYRKIMTAAFLWSFYNRGIIVHNPQFIY